MDSNTSPPLELDCPKKWPFDLKWERSIEEDIGWSEVDNACGIRRAGSEIRNFITYDGPRAFEKVVIQNQIVKKIEAGILDFEKTTRSDVDWQMGNTWEKHLDKSARMEHMYATADAPPRVKEAIDFLSNFIVCGSNHAQQLIKFIEAQQEQIKIRKSEESEARLNARRQARPGKWDQIDVSHSNVKEGFIYALENALMPGVYKVGFTASSPDKRAEQITAQYNLPAAFTVVKYWRTKDPYIVEQQIHKELGNTRQAGEFFAIGLDALVDIVIRKIIS